MGEKSGDEKEKKIRVFYFFASSKGYCFGVGGVACLRCFVAAAAAAAAVEKAARGARYDDPALAIDWPRAPTVIAGRDLQFGPLA